MAKRKQWVSESISLIGEEPLQVEYETEVDDIPHVSVDTLMRTHGAFWRDGVLNFPSSCTDDARAEILQALRNG